MRVLVTGGSGYVGLNLVDRLLRDGHEVTTLARHTSPDLLPQVRQHIGAVTDPRAVADAVADAEIVYHLAGVITLALADERAWRTNTEGTRIVARAALDAGVRRLVLTSSVHAYDDRAPELDEDSPRSSDPDLPVYARSKWRSEQILAEAVQAGLDAVIVNPTGIIGPRDPGRARRLNGLMAAAARGRLPLVTGVGYDVVDVRDVADAIVLAAERGRTGRNYLIGGHHTSIHALCAQAAAVAGRRGPVANVPVAGLRLVAPVLDPVLRRLGHDELSPVSLSALANSPVVHSDRARSELGVRPRPIAETVADFVDSLGLRR